MKADIRDIDDIKFLVDSFYRSAGSDNLLGPIFHGLSDSRGYRDALYGYWNEVLLNQKASTSKPFPKHIEQMFSTQHFIRWLTLFLETIDAHYSGNTAEKAKLMVIRKSEEFQTGMELYRF